MTPTMHAPLLLLSLTLANTNISVLPYDYDDPNSPQGPLDWKRVGVEASEPSLSKNRVWKGVWEGGGQAEEPVEEAPIDGSLENQVRSEHVESTCYLPKCPRLEHACFSGKSKILFAGWALYSPNDIPVTSLPIRQDVVYLMLLEDVPKIYLARDNRDRDSTMLTLDVTPKMRVQITDISKSHGRGVIILRQDGMIHGTLVPISLPRCMFHNHSLVDEEEFKDLAHRTIAPFRRTCYSAPNSEWCHTQYHQEFAPVAQLEAAMHLMFVMDSWMTKMLKL